MAEPQFKHLSCPVAVFHIEDAQVTGDSLADEVRNELLAAYTQVNAVHAVVDLSKVQFLSSAGFRPLLSLHRLLRQQIVDRACEVPAACAAAACRRSGPGTGSRASRPQDRR